MVLHSSTVATVSHQKPLLFELFSGHLISFIHSINWSLINPSAPSDLSLVPQEIMAEFLLPFENCFESGVRKPMLVLNLCELLVRDKILVPNIWIVKLSVGTQNPSDVLCPFRFR
jgi:hypothetical protein